ncbi:alpha/beta fold hydrolase [Leptothoe kymatousa]|uniref:Alpha/beta fold hydrolase n=1 Tax=Leptothoe kymatousa TAU-MAC 1615 TaxID=2364775 RepID=A0ABS5XZI3_9CYAN|nr:alpha/beta fold hydrolase [Leptothoe kymatousa]MBT9311017.1 alpha/beta fold hydrolase [Leptothoe kymatousa TAU-MAC 1615]
MAFSPALVSHRLQQRLARLWQRRFAQRTCELYLGAKRPQAQIHCQEILQTQVRLDANSLQRLLGTDIGVLLLKRLGELLDLPADVAERQALIKRIAKADQLSIMSLLYQIAGNVRADRLLETSKQVDLLLSTTEELLELLQTLMQQESLGQEVLGQEARLAGAYGICQKRLWVRRKGLSSLQVFLYEPLGEMAASIPVVVISHGLAANPQTVLHYAKHFASHGYLVAVPQHAGSDTHQIRNLLAGSVDEVFSLQEFFDRPRDIRALLDELERLNGRDYGGQLDLENVGVLGESFGAYTALALAGATIDFEALAHRCERLSESLNISLLLQCRALSLPPKPGPLSDRRVTAIFTVNPIGSGLFGTEGLAAVTVPTVMVTGSHDKTAPMALEPLQMFPRLGSQERFFAVIRGKSHVHDVRDLLGLLKLSRDGDFPGLTLAPPIIDTYLHGLSLYFFNRYVRQVHGATFHLPAYAHLISQAPYGVSLVSGQSSHALQPVLQRFQQRLSQLKWQTLTMQHQDGMFTVRDGLSLYYQSWLPPSTVKATIVLVHGLGSHSGLFQNVVRALIPEGYAIYGYDLRGHGRSPGQRGYINGWAEYRDDLADLLAMVQQQHAAVPCFLLGHSLGGTIVLDYMRHRSESLAVSPHCGEPSVAGAIAASVPFGPHGATDLRLKLGQVLAWGLPRFSMALGLKSVLPSRDRAVVLAYAHDPLRHQRGTARLAAEFAKTMKQLGEYKQNLTQPILMLHGTADQVADYRVSEEFFAGLPPQQKTFIRYPGAYHELFNEINVSDVMQDISAWLSQYINCE